MYMCMHMKHVSGSELSLRFFTEGPMSCPLLAQLAWCTTPTVASAASLIIGAAPRRWRTTPTAGTSAAPLIIGANALPRRALFALLPAALAMPGVPAPAYASGGATAGKTTSIPRAKVRYYGRMSQVRRSPPHHIVARP
jgi:hypothetical protein